METRSGQEQREPAAALTRRQLLVAMGAIGGAGSVLDALDVLGRGDPPPVSFTPPSRADFSLQGRAHGTRVLVLGAGVAGLCCACELQQAGYDVTVVEARDRVGGRSWTVRGGDSVTDTRGTTQHARFAEGRWFNPGPARIAQHHTTLEYCRQLGVPVEVFVNANADAWIAADGEVRRLRSARVDLDLAIAEVIARVDQAGLDAPVDDDEWTAVLDHLRALGSPPRGTRGWRVPPGAGAHDPVVDDADPLEVLAGLGLAERLAVERDWHQAMPMFHPVGGMDAIPQALAGSLRRPVRTGHVVTRLRTTSDGVSAVVTTPSGAPRRFDADHGICTLPPRLVASLDHDFGATVTRALREPVPVTTGKIALEYDRRFWELDEGIHGGITATDRPPRVIWYPSTGYLGRGGVLVGGYPFGEAALRFSRLPHFRREEWAIEAGEAIHGPVYRTGLRSSFSVDWATMPHSEAAWMHWPREDLYFDRLQGPEGRWWFAGDWVSRTPGWQHGAFESARQVVTGIHELALAER